LRAGSFDVSGCNTASYEFITMFATRRPDPSRPPDCSRSYVLDSLRSDLRNYVEILAFQRFAPGWSLFAAAVPI
jgi:hypothetical protein